MLNYNIKKIGNSVFALLALILIITFSSSAQNDLSIKLDETNINTALTVLTDARGINFGEYLDTYLVEDWYLNVNSASVDIKPNNVIRLHFNVTAVVATNLVFAPHELGEYLDGWVEGYVQIIGNNTDGYKLVFKPTSVDGNSWGTIPTSLSGVFNAIENNAPSLLPNLELNIGTSLLPEFASNYFTSGIPNLTTSENEIILGWTISGQRSVKVQNDVNGDHSIGNIEVYEQTGDEWQWNSYPSPKRFWWDLNSTHHVRVSSSIIEYDNENWKFNRWNANETTNEITILVDNDKTKTASFRPVQQLTVQTDLEGMGNNGNVIYQGNSVASPYTDYAFIAPTNTSIGAPQTQTGINNIPFNFLQWSDGETSPDRIVSITTPSTFTAQYKAHLASSTSEATEGSAQHKMLSPDGKNISMVYESGGTVFLSDFDGSQWSFERPLSPLGTREAYYRNPSWSTQGSSSTSTYIWETMNILPSGDWEHKITLENTFEFSRFGAPETQNAMPVVSIGTHPEKPDLTMAVWRDAEHLKYGVVYWNNGFSISLIDNIRESTNGAKNPSIAFDSYIDPNLAPDHNAYYYFHLAWEDEKDQQIYYQKVKVVLHENGTIDTEWDPVICLTERYRELSWSKNPVVVLDQEEERPGVPHVVWYGLVGEDPRKISQGISVFHISADDDWQTLTQISHQGHLEFNPTVAISSISGRNYLRCLWQCDDHLAFADELMPRGEWSNPQDIRITSTENAINPNIISIENNFFGIWTQNNQQPYTICTGVVEITKSGKNGNSAPIIFRRGTVDFSEDHISGNKESKLSGALWSEMDPFMADIGDDQVSLNFSRERDPSRLDEWLGTESFIISSHNETIRGLGKLTLSEFLVQNIDSVQNRPVYKVELIDAITKHTITILDLVTLQDIINWNTSDTTAYRPINANLNLWNGRDVIVKVSLFGQRENIEDPAWSEIIFGGDQSDSSKQNLKGNSTPFDIPTVYALEQNYPNPFNPVTQIKYQLPQNSFVTLKVYDMLGREVATLANEEQSAGYKSVEFDAAKFPSGVYIYKLTAGNFVETKKMVLLK